jgi:hypothetical protein
MWCLLGVFSSCLACTARVAAPGRRCFRDWLVVQRFEGGKK